MNAIPDDPEPDPPAVIKWLKKSWFWWLIRQHATKVLGFSGVTIGALSAATNFLTPRQLQEVIVATGILTAWRGFFNSKP